MYLEHFSLQESPFGIDSDPRFTYFGEQHREALSSLYVSILEGRGISAVIAQPGMGKTTLVNYLLARLQDRSTICRLEYPYRRRSDLMGGILAGLGLDSSEERDFHQIRLLERFCIEQARTGRKTLLFVDEAQALSVESMEQVRLVSNLRDRGKTIVEIVLAGHPSLAHAIRFPELQALRQRIGVMTHIEPFDEAGVRKYVAHRLQVAGRTDPVFRCEALEVVAFLSQGIPRNINHLCHSAMMLACAQEDSRVSEDTVWEAGEEMRLDLEFTPGELVPADPVTQAGPAPVSGLSQLPGQLRPKPVAPSERIAAEMIRRAEPDHGEAARDSGEPVPGDILKELDSYDRQSDFVSSNTSPLRDRARPHPPAGRGRFGRRSRR
jgi:type II secretory pathway predicted ATPase ExeA